MPIGPGTCSCGEQWTKQLFGAPPTDLQPHAHAWPNDASHMAMINVALATPHTLGLSRRERGASTLVCWRVMMGVSPLRAAFWPDPPRSLGMGVIPSP